MDCVCTKSVNARNMASGRLKATIRVINNLPSRLKSVGKIKAFCGKDIAVKSTASTTVQFLAKENVSCGPSIEHNHDNSNIRGDVLLNGAFRAKLSSTGKFTNGYTDKINTTSIEKYSQQYLEKLYPIQDIETSLNNTYFVSKNFASGNLYSNIDEGILTKNYDELSSYIQPSSIYTEGSFRYKCKVSPSLIRPEDSILLIRASAPRSTYSSNIPPSYYISNIKLEDASGNLIIQYNDILVRGDANYSDDSYKNFTTYIAKPSINYANQNTWKNYYPSLGSGLLSQAYSLNLDFDVQCLDDPFNEGFGTGYSEGCEVQSLDSTTNNNYLSLDGAPLSDQSQGYSLNPNNSIRITAIEICNSGARVTLTDHYLPFYNQVSSSGQRIIRDIFPSEVLPYDYNTTIYPTENSVWSSYPISKTNVSADGLETLKSYLRDVSNSNYITLNSTSSIPDSGKLKLVFSHERPKFVSQYTGGSFSFGGLSNQSNFTSAKLDAVAEVDNFFTIDSIELKIIAKKSAGSRDYTIDVVGYSDDKLLCSTPKIGGFLQNTEGSGYIPVSSGFNSINDLGIGSETLSDKHQFYTASSTNNSGGDHYLISTSPVINSTEFTEYSIPLKIYEDSVELGQSTDYSMSSYFEKLYLDIFPIPSGASISHVKLVVTYKPSNALKLHTIGHGYDELFRRILKLNVNNDYISSSGSTISNLPHAYKDEESTLKYNYAKRWRGVFGKAVAGPYDPNSFDFSYYNPELITPFLNGYFSFNYDSGNSIISDYSYEKSRLNAVSTGTYVGSYNRTQNIGLRFRSQSLFSQSTPYTTIDWTSITGYEAHELKNRISDSFDNAVRVSGNLGYINFGNIVCSSGFAVFARFSPDISMSGAGYNLWNSGVIFSKFDSGKNLEFALSYYNGKLRGSARTSSGSIITIDDSKYYYEYEYPLCTMLSYNENGDNKLRLFTDTLKNTSSSFSLHDNTSNLTIGYSSGSGVGINAFITDVGISASSGVNILSSGEAELLPKEVLYSNFISGINNGLYSHIDDDIDAWHLGDFKICSFNQDYDRFTTRIGSDFIVHHLKHNGSGYNQINNYTYPSSVNTSGVSYHTQIENDFLRFYLQDAFDVHQGFYSAQPRISKDLPRGYSFEDRAFVVETILDHVTHNDIVWSDGKRGPKLIVSLYTPNKNPAYRDDKINWGLINRHEHYLEPSGCYHKLSSTFSYEDLLNQNETWSNYDLDRNLTEFEAKYYSTDINDMFLQYDLVYPSGSSFDSIIKFHSAQVKLENAIVKKLDSNNSLNLNVYGSGYQFDILNISLPYRSVNNIYDSPSGLSLYMDANILGSTSGSLNLYSSGTYHYNDSMSLHTISFVSLDSEDEEVFGESLFGSNPRRFNLFTVAEYGTSSQLPLIVSNKLEDQSANESLMLLMYQKEKLQESLSLYIDTPGTLVDRVPFSVIPLFTRVYSNTELSSLADNVISTGMSLFIDTYELNSFSDSMPLMVGKELFVYNHNNVGKAIEIDDNEYSSLAANDEIRGVETVCFGNCYNGKPCIEQEIKTHDTVWYSERCIDGGLLRGQTTYTNISTSGFNTPVGYSGHYYGIRKFDNLIPNNAYLIEMQCNTGDDSKIKLPFEINEVEYGYNNNANYSGIKLIGDYPYCASGRNANDQYGKSVAICGDLMAVGAPFHTLYDSGNYKLENAGAVFLYRRDAAPSGHTWDYHKAQWNLETKLTLPSSILRDYYVDTPSQMFINDVGYATTTRQWFVGQEGRQFGHSLALSTRNGKEVLAIGAPSAKFSRTFEQLEPSGVNIGLFIFTDEFIPLNYDAIIQAINNKDKVFQYFSDPPTKFNVKIIICEPIGGSNLTSSDFSEPKPSFIVKQVIDRHRNEIINSSSFLVKDLNIYSGIKRAYDLAFPYDNTKLNNNIPAILGFYVDDSRSLGERAIQPALNNFIDYHKQYAFASGLKDFYGYASSGSIIKSLGLEENWVAQSVSILNTTLDTGRLALNDEFKLFSNGVGPEAFNENLSEFNIVPNSGGAVYIFENVSGQWDLKQTIDSPTTLKNITPDRFGHSLDISENGELIVIGSPYIDKAIMAFEYNIESDQYINNFTYGYSNIPFAGSWKFLTEKQCPSSRLGYSVATNEDGSIIAAGAPTDSMDEFDDTNTYYSPAREQFSVWPTYVNAGAVRLFESRKYYTHNKALEYGIFGNLDYNLHSVEHSGLYNHFNAIYNDLNVEFSKSPFGENIDIPDDVGLLFINTPYVDAFSNEVKDKIINWLSLGDRNLVLVGNDPIWEKDGIYETSNLIINKILNGLQSRMRIVPARNQYESVAFSGALNVIPATRPNKSMSTYLSANNMYGSGVADIKVYAPNVYETFSCFDGYVDINNKCAMPLQHNGDLRAEWGLSCQDAAGNSVTYYMNWPMKFGTVTPLNYTCVDPQFQNIAPLPTIGYEPLPVLAAAEFENPQTLIYPGVPERSGLVPTGYNTVLTGYNYSAQYGSPVDNTVAFEWSTNSSSNYISLNTNINNTSSESRFYKPESYNDKNPILQAKASNKLVQNIVDKVVSDKTYFAAEETYSETSSKIILIAGTFLERQETLLNGLGDRNINFYSNLISKNADGQSCVAQLGGWTQITDFTDAEAASVIKQKLEDLGNIIDINVSTSMLNTGHITGDIALPLLEYNVCWIANAQSLPSDAELEDIKTWLNSGNKKLVVTYKNDIKSVQIAKSLCDKLNLSMKPLYLTEKSKFADNFYDRPRGYNGDNVNEIVRNILYLNPSHISSIGYRPQDSILSINNIVNPDNFVPIQLNNAVSIAYNNIPIMDNDLISTGLWQLKTGVTEVTFDVLPGSGYKLFIDVASEDISENQPLYLYIANANTLPSLDPVVGPGSIPIYDINDSDIYEVVKTAKVSKIVGITSLPDGEKKTQSYYIQIPNNENKLTLYFTGNNLRLYDQSTTYTPRTVRLLSVSGCAININTITTPETINYPIYGWEVYPAIPETVVQLPARIREISTGSNKYCVSSGCASNFDNRLIADGPVVVAQELEQVSEFDNGVNRSRITLISDSSLLQGPTIANSQGVIHESHKKFLQSLYPLTQFPATNGNRVFDTITKIMSPERGSPQIYFTSTANSGLNIRFLNGYNNRTLSEFHDHISDYATFNRALMPHEAEDGDPTFLTRRPDPMPEAEAQARMSGVINTFASHALTYGASPKFKGVINGTMYEDIGCLGGTPQIMKDTGYDYLDFDYFKTGYPGNLFGYSIDIKGKTLFIGAPFVAYSGEYITSWSGVKAITAPHTVPSGSLVGYNGGAGSVYVYNKTGTGITPYSEQVNWSCTRKIRPRSINIGQDTNNIDLLGSGFYLGSNNYIGNDIEIDVKVNDQFGHALVVDGDTLAIGAPGHDFETYYENVYNSGSFVRKEFNIDLDIPQRKIYDLGQSGIRNTLSNSGVSVLNNGAIYIYENKIVDSANRTQNWIFVDKITQQGYKSRLQKTYVGSQNIPVSGSENDRFGSVVAINRTNRSDADYTIVAGVKEHKFATSGNHISSQPILKAGAAYSYDIILKDQGYAEADPNSWIDARVYGQGSGQIYFRTYNNIGLNSSISNTGIVYSNDQGELFIEISGQDPKQYVFINHRPYVDFVRGNLIVGTGTDNNIPLFIEGSPYSTSGTMDIFMNASNSAVVYNNLGLYQYGASGFSYNLPSGLTLYAHCPNSQSIGNSGLNIYNSGIGIYTDNFSMAVRGK